MQEAMKFGAPVWKKKITQDIMLNFSFCAHGRNLTK